MLEIQNRKVEELITYSIDQQIQIYYWTERPQTTINLDELNNFEICGALLIQSLMARNGQLMTLSKIWVFILQKQVHVS